MAVVLQGFAVVVQVEVSVAQLAVDGTEDLQVLRAYLDGRLEERDTGAVVTHLTQALTFQSQLQTGRLHPTQREREREQITTNIKRELRG